MVQALFILFSVLKVVMKLFSVFFSGTVMVNRKLFSGTVCFGNRINMWPLCWAIKKITFNFQNSYLMRCIFSNNPGVLVHSKT